MKYTVENTCKIGNPMRVFLDGDEVKWVAECDTDEGYIIACVTDEDGHWLAKDGKPLTQRLEGVVTVEPVND